MSHLIFINRGVQSKGNWPWSHELYHRTRGRRQLSSRNVLSSRRWNGESNGLRSYNDRQGSWNGGNCDSEFTLSFHSFSNDIADTASQGEHGIGIGKKVMQMASLFLFLVTSWYVASMVLSKSWACRRLASWRPWKMRLIRSEYNETHLMLALYDWRLSISWLLNPGKVFDEWPNVGSKHVVRVHWAGIHDSGDSDPLLKADSFKHHFIYNSNRL